MKTNNKPLYILLHIPKCGGTSINTHIISRLKRSEYIALGANSDRLFESQTLLKAYISSIPQKDADTLKLIVGHFAFYGIHKFINRPCRYVVFLRNPYNRTVSNYAFAIQMVQRGHKSKFINRGLIYNKQKSLYPFNEWVKEKVIMHNYMVRFLYKNFFNRQVTGEITQKHAQAVLQILEKFYFVGITESLTDQAYLFQKLGVAPIAKRINITRKTYIPKHIDMNGISQYLLHDLTLYNHFKTKNKLSNRIKLAFSSYVKFLLHS